jgi:iron complex outermembrane receptor protein
MKSLLTKALRLSLPLLLSGLVPLSVRGQSSKAPDLTQISLEDLMNIQVTSVSKKEQKLARAGAAVYVITQEDIRRSGATNIPDVLRMAPGVNVAQIDTNSWAISVRGFNDRYADKVLVLIDGRSVYSMDTSGVFWDQQNVPLEDIERIEVIRGPGGTVWGANAVNGVINIITKSAKATQGGMISAGGGSSEHFREVVQYGGKAGTRGTYRAFGEHSNTDGSVSPAGERAADGWHMFHGGFRSDWDLSARDSVTVEGDLFSTTEGETLTTLFSSALPQAHTRSEKVTVGGGDILGRWNRTLSNGSDVSVQAYYDRYDRSYIGAHDILETTAFDFEHHLAIGSRHDLVWGAGYRYTNDHFTRGYAANLLPRHPTDSLFSTYVQDEIRLTNSLWFTLGSKFEHNAFTGFETEPSAQLVWTPTRHQAVWTSASRAIRQPARKDTDVQLDYSTQPLPGGGFALIQINGNPKLKAEQLRDLEAGYRAQLSRRLSFDIAGFLSRYRDLLTQVQGTPSFTADPGPPHLLIPLTYENALRIHTAGAEFSATWNVSSRWKVSPGFSMIRMHLAPNAFRNAGKTGVIGNTPKNQFQVRSFLNLTRRLEWDSSVSYVGRLTDLGSGPTPGYTRVDTRLGWRAGDSVELSITGQNLLTPRHAESPDFYPVHHTLVERSVFGKVTWRF